MIENVKDMIKRHEGLRLEPYKCPAGHWTVGYGHNLEVHGEPIPERITIDQAEEYLNEDIADATRDCKQRIACFNELDEVRQAVLIDMCFNMGIWGLLTFKRMLKWVSKAFWGQATIEMLNSKWAEQVGHRAVTLANMMGSGEWPKY